MLMLLEFKTDKLILAAACIQDVTQSSKALKAVAFQK